MSDAPHLSIVIPVYNEEGIVRGSVLELEEKLRKKPRAVHTYGDLRELFYDATERYADRTALRHLTARGTQRVTYRKLRQMSEPYASWNDPR